MSDLEYILPEIIEVLKKSEPTCPMHRVDCNDAYCEDREGADKKHADMIDLLQSYLEYINPVPKREQRP